MNLAQIHLYRYRLPLRKPVPLPESLLYERQGVLLRFIGDDGSEGWGEAAPLPGISRETLAQAETALILCAETLAQHPFPNRIDELQACGLLEPLALPSVSFAVEAAALSLRAAMANIPVCHSLKANLKQTILINALLHGSETEILEKARGLSARGFRAAKLKVGRAAMEKEIALVHAVRDALGPEIALRLDANQAWDLETAVAFAKNVAECRIEYIEEPLWDPWLLSEFWRETNMPLALDETLYAGLVSQGDQGPADFYQLCGGIEAAILKPSLLHMPGFAALLGTVGMPARKIVISASYESGIGIAALAQYAAVFSGHDVPVGLDTYDWLDEDVLTERLPLQNGEADIDAICAAARTVNFDRLTPIWSSHRAE